MATINMRVVWAVQSALEDLIDEMNETALEVGRPVPQIKGALREINCFDTLLSQMEDINTELEEMEEL